MNQRNPANPPTTLRHRAGWLAALALAAASASAAPPLGTIEECLESGTDLVQLPGVAGGTLSARECRGCPSLRLGFDRNTRFFIGDRQVSYAALREAASKGDYQLDVFYRPGNRTLTRLRLAAVGPAQ